MSKLLEDVTPKPKKPSPDMCGCSNCDWKGKTTDCELVEESEGWEYPTYWVHLCPECEDGGCIDNYWYSDEQWELAEQFYTQEEKGE